VKACRLYFIFGLALLAGEPLAQAAETVVDGTWTIVQRDYPTESRGLTHAIFTSDRADGRYLSTRGAVHEMVRTTKPALAFDPSLSPEEFVRWRGQVKDRLRELLAFPALPPAPPPKRLGCERRDGYTLERWEHYPMDKVAVPYLVLVPDGVSAERPAPAVLCLPGTSMTKESSAGEPELNPVSAIYDEYVPENRMALQYCRAGFVAVAVDNPGVGETADLERIVGGRARHLEEIRAFGHHLLNLGWSYMGYAAYVDHRLLERLRLDPRIDRTRIALSGHSLGAWMAGWLTVLNEDVAAVVVNQGVYRWQEAVKTLTRPNERGDRPEILGMGVFYFIPGLYRYLDMPDIHAAIAPRPLLLAEGVPERDRLAVYEPAWRIAGNPGNLTIVPFGKYADPASRYRGDPPEGLGDIGELYRYYSNDAPRHFFKGSVAVPWLKGRMERRSW